MASIINATTSSGVAVSGDTSGVLQLATNGGTTAVTIDTSQNVGIGTTTPPAYSGYTTLALNSGTNGGLLDIQLGGTRVGSFQAGSSTELRMYAGASVASTFYAGGSERMRITSAGDVGIGTTTPSTKLNVYGSSPSIYLEQNSGVAGNTQVRLNAAGGANTASVRLIDKYIWTSTSNGSLLNIGNDLTTSQMSISSAGNVGIGTSNPIYPLQIVNSTGSLNLYIQNTNASANGDMVQVAVSLNTTNGTTRPYAYYNAGAGAYRFYVLDSGNCQNTNGSYGAFSDVKLKENIVDATPKLADLCKVKVRQYNLKKDQTHKQIGVVAQELEEVFAGLVEEIADKDAEGNDLGTTTKTVKYSVFVPMLIKAIQEQQALITTLQTQVAALTAKVGN